MNPAHDPRRLFFFALAVAVVGWLAPAAPALAAAGAEAAVDPVTSAIILAGAALVRAIMAALTAERFGRPLRRVPAEVRWLIPLVLSALAGFLESVASDGDLLKAALAAASVFGLSRVLKDVGKGLRKGSEERRGAGG